MDNTTRNMLTMAAAEIRGQRAQNERMGIRLQAFDDCVALMNGTRSTKGGGAMHPDPLYEIEQFLRDNPETL
jgi:hypothetical protein